MADSFHSRYLALVAEIERRFPVAQWRSEDIPMWPIARMDLYLDMFGQTPEAFAGRFAPSPCAALQIP